MTSHCMPWVCLSVFAGHPWYVQLSSAQDPSLHLLVTPGLAGRAECRTGLAWETWALSEWGQSLGPSSCVSDEDWVRHRHQWASVICCTQVISDITKLSAALLRTQSPECYEDGRRPQQQHTVHRWLLGPAAEGQKAACRFPQCLHPHGETPRWRWVMMVPDLCITGLGMLLHPSVILDTDVTNKGVILKNYSEQFLLSLSSRRHRACLSPAPDQVWCRQRAVAWWRWGVVFWSLSRHYFHLRVNGCMRAWAAKRACIREYSESYHNLTNSNNNTHRVIQSGHSESSWCQGDRDRKWWNGFRHPRPCTSHLPHIFLPTRGSWY